MKIEFAPLSIPLQRRLQTAAVVQWVFSFLGLAQCCIVLFAGLLFTRFWLISALYAAWWAWDWDTPSKGGRRLHCIQNSVVWRYMRDYFPITVPKKRKHFTSDQKMAPPNQPSRLRNSKPFQIDSGGCPCRPEAADQSVSPVAPFRPAKFYSRLHSISLYLNKCVWRAQKLLLEENPEETPQSEEESGDSRNLLPSHKFY